MAAGRPPIPAPARSAASIAVPLVLRHVTLSSGTVAQSHL